MNGCQTSNSRTTRPVDGLMAAVQVTRVRDVMLRNPKVMNALVSIEEARAVLTNYHVHMVLLTEGSTLVGTLVRTDLPQANDGSGQGSCPAMAWSTLRDRTTAPGACADGVQGLLIERGLRRLAVVNDDHTLLGLMCLKRSRTGFCSDEDVASRAPSRRVLD